MQRPMNNSRLHLLHIHWEKMTIDREFGELPIFCGKMEFYALNLGFTGKKKQSVKGEVIKI